MGLSQMKYFYTTDRADPHYFEPVSWYRQSKIVLKFKEVGIGCIFHAEEISKYLELYHYI